MKQDEIIEMARQTLSKDIDGLWLAGTLDLEDFAKLVAAKERERIIALLKGIDQTEIESAEGWWETSNGAEFGTDILSKIRSQQ